MSSSIRPPYAVDKPVVKRAKGACAECRRKRSRCDRSLREGSSCTNCEISNIECIAGGSQKSEAERLQNYVRILEARVKRLENYIQALFPNDSIDAVISRPPPYSDNRISRPSCADLARRSLASITAAKDASAGLDNSLKSDDYADAADEDNVEYVALVEELRQLTVTPLRSAPFIGQASPIMAIKHAATLKSQVTGEPDGGLDPNNYRRPVFWTMSPWEEAYVTSFDASYVYPEPHLLLSLVTLYFEKTNSLIPILHQPTFMKALMAGRHHVDPLFGMTVLLVCANGSKYSSDPRVCYAPDSVTPTMSRGWQYFCQVPIHRKVMFYTPTVYDLQYYSLAAVYMSCASLCSVPSNLICIGLRYAIELGAHRRKGQPPSVENEQAKRAFWALFCLDAINSSFYGRPAGIPHDTFDVEYPIECDDEFWVTNNPHESFKQPAGKPSIISSFVNLIKLCEILSFCSRNLYRTKKSRVIYKYFDDEWQMRMVAELDSSLNKWKTSLPLHLLWDPNGENEQFFQQSAYLHSVFYYVQMQAHRPFVAKKSEMSPISITMCTNAARACSHIQDAAISRECRIHPHTTYIAFAAGITSVLCLWTSRLPDHVGDDKKDMDNLLKCSAVLEKCEVQWHSAGTLRDMLSQAGCLEQYTPRRFARSDLANNVGREVHVHDPLQDLFASALPDDTNWTANNWTANNWDYSGLFLAEMGHRNPHINDVYPTTTQVQRDIQPQAYPSAIDHTITWMPGPSVLNRFEDWDPYPRNPDDI